MVFPSSSTMTVEDTAEVTKLLQVCNGEKTRSELQESLSLKHDENFRKAYIKPALEQGLIEMTIPDKPKSRLQKYRLTALGKEFLTSSST